MCLLTEIREREWQRLMAVQEEQLARLEALERALAAGPGQKL